MAFFRHDEHGLMSAIEGEAEVTLTERDFRF
jgi:hypothetical protein